MAAEAPTITFSVPKQTYRMPYTASATSNVPGATFTYSVVSGPATISGATVTFTGAGTVLLEASEAAIGDFAAGTKQATFSVLPPPPTLSPAPGTYDSVQNVTITSAISSTASGGTIYYTTNGSSPTTASTVYTGPINVPSNETVKAMVTSNNTQSPVTTGAYKITPPATAPVFSVPLALIPPARE